VTNEQIPCPKHTSELPAGLPIPASLRALKPIKLASKVLCFCRFFCIVLLIVMLGAILQMVNRIYAFSLSKSFEHLPTSELLGGLE